MNASIALNVDDSSSVRWGVAYNVQQLSSATTRRAIRLGGRLPWWLDSVAMRLAQLDAIPAVELRGSRPMNVEDVVDALMFMDRAMADDTVVPWIGRLASGGVQLTWHVGEVEAEAVFDRAHGDRELLVSVGDNEWEAPIDSAETLFATVADRLSESHVEQTSA